MYAPLAEGGRPLPELELLVDPLELDDEEDFPPEELLLEELEPEEELVEELLLLETPPLLELDEELVELAVLPEELLDDVEDPEEPKVTTGAVLLPLPPLPPHATRRRTLRDTRTDWMVARIGFPCYQ